MRLLIMQDATQNKINWEAVIQIVFLFGFSLFFSYLIISNRVRLYVHPRMVPAMLFAIPAMGLIALFTVKEVFRPKRKFTLGPYLFFLVPLVLAFALPATSMDPSSMSLSDINLTRQFGKSGISQNSMAPDLKSSDDGSDLPKDFFKNLKVTAANFASLAALANKPKDRGLRLQNNTIVMGDINFYRWLNELYDNVKKYQGRKIQVIGFVFRDKTVKDNEFIPARLLMVCCTADLQTVGMLCRYDKVKSLKLDSWVKVTGTIRIIDFKGQRIPIIEAEDVTSTAKPTNEYIYPF